MLKEIEVVVFEGALPLDITGAVAVFSAATSLLQAKGGSDGYILRYAAKKKGSVLLSGAFPMCVECVIGESGHTDMLLIPGSVNIAPALDDTELIQMVSAAIAKCERVVSVCSGSGILAATGALNGKVAATHWFVANDFSERFPQVTFDASLLYKKDKNIYTSAGVTTGIDLALSIVEEDWGHEIAMQVARILVVYYRRPGWQTQFSPLLAMQTQSSSRFAALEEWIQNNYSEKITVEMLAEYAGMSTRNFARVFRNETGKTPAKYVEEVRLEHVRSMLESGMCDLDHVAQATGFGREERMLRAFARTFGISPRQFISHFSVAKERA